MVWGADSAGDGFSGSVKGRIFHLQMNEPNEDGKNGVIVVNMPRK